MATPAPPFFCPMMNFLGDLSIIVTIPFPSRMSASTNPYICLNSLGVKVIVLCHTLNCPWDRSQDAPQAIGNQPLDSVVHLAVGPNDFHYEAHDRLVSFLDDLAGGSDRSVLDSSPAFHVGDDLFPGFLRFHNPYLLSIVLLDLLRTTALARMGHFKFNSRRFYPSNDLKTEYQFCLLSSRIFFDFL